MPKEGQKQVANIHCNTFLHHYFTLMGKDILQQMDILLQQMDIQQMDILQQMDTLWISCCRISYNKYQDILQQMKQKVVPENCWEFL